MGNHEKHFQEIQGISHAILPYYTISRILPMKLFFKKYPENPGNFGERLRKARIDAGLKIKELASILGVTADTVINWELRGRKPVRREVREKVERFMMKYR